MNAPGGGGFWPSVVLVAVCVVATVSAEPPPVAQIGTLTVPADTLAVVWDPASVRPIRRSVLNDLNTVLKDNRYWLASHPSDPNIDCAKVKANTLKALSGKQNGGANWFEGVDTIHHGAFGEDGLARGTRSAGRAGRAVAAAGEQLGPGLRRARRSVARAIEAIREALRRARFRGPARGFDMSR